jgi:hypothetical protein
MEIAAPQSLVGADVSRTSGYLDPILASPFRADRDGLPSTPSPAPIRVRVHPLLSVTLLRSSSCVAPAGRVATSSAFRGVSSLFATSVPRVHISAGVPCRPSFRPRRFARPRRLPPRCTWWACFIPLPRPGFSLQGFSPATQPYRLVGGLMPSRRWWRLPCRGSFPRRQVSVTSPSGPCSGIAIRCAWGGS